MGRKEIMGTYARTPKENISLFGIDNSVMGLEKHTKVMRHAERGRYDLDTIKGILDEGMVCHVAFSQSGQLFNIPMIYARNENTIFLHTSIKSRIYEVLSSGTDICVTVTLVDGIVLAKSAFHSSLNYRSVILFGKSAPIEETGEKLEVARLITEKITPGRWNDCRIPREEELRATGFLKLEIDEVSAKIREGPPVDDPTDANLSYWSGVIPIELKRKIPVSVVDPEKTPFPEYLRNI